MVIVAIPSGAGNSSAHAAIRCSSSSWSKSHYLASSRNAAFSDAAVDVSYRVETCDIAYQRDRLP